MKNRYDPLRNGATAAAVAEPPQPVIDHSLAAAFPSGEHTRPRVLPSAPPPKDPPKPKGGLKKLSFGAIPVKKEETRTAYPVYDNPEASIIAARIKLRSEELKALEGALETDKAELKQTVGLFFFQANHGRHEIPSSISVPSAQGEVLVCFQNRYKKIESDEAIVGLLGEIAAEKWFKPQDEMVIDLSQIDMDKAQLLVDELAQVFAKYQVTDAVSVKSQIKPVKDFHTARHTVFTVEQNMAIEDVAPIIAMIKTQGRGDEKK